MTHHSTDEQGNVVGITVDPAVYEEPLAARREHSYLRALHETDAPDPSSTIRQQNIRALRGLGKEVWNGIDTET